MIIDHTDVVESLLARHLIPTDDKHNFVRAPIPEEIVWYEMDDYVINLYRSIDATKPWSSIPIVPQDEVEDYILRMGYVPCEIGRDFKIRDVSREVIQWVPVLTDDATVRLLESQNEVYIVYQGAIWWGRTTAELLTDPFYIWLVDRQIQTVRGAL